MSGKIRVRAVAHGRVQGVWFRDSTRRRAQQLGVTGWVRNRDDGTVELEAEGDPEAVEQLVAWARVGPEHARVASVDVEHVDPVGDALFEVR